MAKNGEPMNLNRASWLCVAFGHKFLSVYDEIPKQMTAYCPPFGTMPEIVYERRFSQAFCQRCGSGAQQGSETSQ